MKSAYLLPMAFLAALSLGIAANSLAQEALPVYGPNLYTELANWGETIPPGTVINHQNWEKYKRFMTIGQQMLWSGKYFWKIPPEGVMVISATTSFPVPKQYREDTEKYSGQVRLVKDKDGGYVADDYEHNHPYVAGEPFPALKLSDPLLSYKLLYDLEYRYGLNLSILPDFTALLIDRLGNVTKTVSFGGVYKLMHLSDPGPVLVSKPEEDTFYVINIEQKEPEQAKYTVALVVFHRDLDRDQDLYAFIPSLRRSLRLSTAARCAPILGSDATQEDNGDGINILPGQFNSTYIGQKSILWMVLEGEAWKSEKNDYDLIKPLYWPKASSGKWQVRKVWIFDLTRVPSLAAGYCYGDRVAFMDAENSMILNQDVYDNNHKYWKSIWEDDEPAPIPLTQGDLAIQGNGAGVMIQPFVDFQNYHETISVQRWVHINTEVPEKYRNLQRYAFPSGLDQVME